MKIIDRYIAKFFISYFFSSIAIFTSLFILVDVLQRSLKDGLTMALVHYCLLTIPYTVSQMVPIACLMATLFTLTTLAKSSELIAIHACGISLERLSAIILVIAGIIGVSNFFISDYIVPPALKKAEYVYYVEVRHNKTFQLFRADRLWYRAKNAIYNIDYFNPENKSINGISIYFFDDSFKLIEYIAAQQATYEQNRWTLINGNSTTFLDEFPISHKFQSKVAEYITEKPQDLKEISNLNVLSFQELQEFIHKNKEAGFDTTRHEVNLHAKIAYALACILMAFLGIPFSTKSQRSGGLALSFGMGLAIAFSYWMCLNAGLSFGYKKTLPPLISAWIANVLFFILGVYFIKYQQRMQKLWPF